MNVRRHSSTANEFQVSVAELARTPGAHRHIRFSGVLEDLATSGARVPDAEPLEVDVTLESVSEGILVSGTVHARYVGECRRCLGVASGELAVEFRELASEEPLDELTYPLRPDLVDLAPIVHDACILALPLAPLCREECLGICSECGANRNLEQCSCAPRRDPRFDVLDLLRGSPAEREGDTPMRDE